MWHVSRMRNIWAKDSYILGKVLLVHSLQTIIHTLYCFSRSFFRKEKGQKFVATRSGVTIRVADELKDFGEILEAAILAGTTAGSLSRRQIVNEADDITRRNPDLAYSDIGRIVGQAIKVGSKTYVHRQAVSNIMAARLIRDTVVNMHVQQEATQYATEGDHPQDAQELEADYAYSQELLTD